MMEPAPARARSPKTVLRRVNVRMPKSTGSADALFILMRQMRTPLVLIIIIFAVDTIGLTMMPGKDADGNLYYMTLFDAFYHMSITATTIGFSETPYTFSIPQRMWLTFAIYTSVLGWAYMLGVLLALFRDRAFQDAVARQRFGRQVRLLHEPFLIIAGYGQMGRRVAEALDAQGRRLVVIDSDEEALDELVGGKLSIDVPGLDGDARDPRSLTLAGLTHPYCEGVLALTHNDSVNLSVVMAVQLIRPEVPVYARANNRRMVTTMTDFKADAVINPFDRFGDYLQVRLQRPITFQLVTWLLATYHTPLGKRQKPLPQGRWVVSSDDHFAEDLGEDLLGIATGVTVLPGDADLPSMVDVVGFIAGTTDENRNLALAAQARIQNPEIFITVRASSEALLPLLTAFAPDSVFFPSRLTAEEALARVITPDFWTFFEYAFKQSDAWAEPLLNRLIERQGEGSPTSRRFVLDAYHAPGAVQWLAHHPLRLGDLLRDPEERDHFLKLVPLIVTRGVRDVFVPDDDFELRVGDEIVVAGHDSAMDTLDQILSHTATVQYVSTGEVVPATWLFRKLSPRVPDA